MVTFTIASTILSIMRVRPSSALMFAEDFSDISAASLMPRIIPSTAARFSANRASSVSARSWDSLALLCIALAAASICLAAAADCVQAPAWTSAPFEIWEIADMIWPAAALTSWIVADCSSAAAASSSHDLSESVEVFRSSAMPLRSSAPRFISSRALACSRTALLASSAAALASSDAFDTCRAPSWN